MSELKIYSSLLASIKEFMLDSMVGECPICRCTDMEHSEECTVLVLEELENGNK
jgi:hypothetical protein